MSVSFPTGDSNAEKSARLTAASITLQNLDGPGKGCPVVSTTFPLQQKAIDAGTDATTPANPPANNISDDDTPAKNIPANNTIPVNNTPAKNTSVNTTPINNTQASGVLDAATITQLAPPLGFESGVNPTGTGDCDGAINGTDGKPIKIPCDCPPAQDVYISVCLAENTSSSCIEADYSSSN